MGQSRKRSSRSSRDGGVELAKHRQSEPNNRALHMLFLWSAKKATETADALLKIHELPASTQSPKGVLNCNTHSSPSLKVRGFTPSEYRPREVLAKDRRTAACSIVTIAILDIANASYAPRQVSVAATICLSLRSFCCWFWFWFWFCSVSGPDANLRVRLSVTRTN